MKLFRRSSLGSKGDDRSTQESASSPDSCSHDFGGSIEKKQALHPKRLICFIKSNKNGNHDEELNPDSVSRLSSYGANSIIEGEQRDDVKSHHKHESLDEHNTSFVNISVCQVDTEQYIRRRKQRHRQQQRQQPPPHQIDHCLVDDLTTIPSESNVQSISASLLNYHINDHIVRHLQRDSEIPKVITNTEETLDDVFEPLKLADILERKKLFDAKRNRSGNSDDMSTSTGVSSMTSNTASIWSSSVTTAISLKSVETSPIIFSPRDKKSERSHHASRASRNQSSKRNANYICRSESVIYSNLDTIEEDNSLREIVKSSLSSSSLSSSSSSSEYSTSGSESYTESEYEDREPSVIYAKARLKSLKSGNKPNGVGTVYTKRKINNQGCVGGTFNYYLKDFGSEEREL
mmetsp:Transcript_16576/g.45656  ORF Transcript_16576/g.45656 Transcript_16576/m.45656 type:complete len:405 (+) Transcript_16576:125-1339(+)